MKIFHLFILLVMIALASACAPIKPENMHVLTANVAKVQYGVVLQPTGNELKIRSHAKGWKKAGKKDGYVGFDEDESGLVTFGLKNEDIDDACSPPNGQGTATWVITRIELSATGDESTEKGTNFGGDQNAYPWLKEAFPGVNLDDGSIFTTQVRSEGRTSVTIFSANEQEDETVAYYRVTATKCSNGDTRRTDPAIRNGGRK